jgi:predicted regulator of Ras-like GTPase activity (Roadblock/LC7/MglB family)
MFEVNINIAKKSRIDIAKMGMDTKLRSIVRNTCSPIPPAGAGRTDRWSIVFALIFVFLRKTL